MRHRTSRTRQSHRFMHKERRMCQAQALGRIPACVRYLTTEQLKHVVGITHSIPLNKWIHQERIAVAKIRARDKTAMFARADVIRFATNRFSPYSLLEARLFRSGVSLLATAGATGMFAR